MTINTREAVVLSKIESTYGVDSTPSGSANAVLCKMPTVTPIEATELSRDIIKPYLGGIQKLLAGIYSKVDVEVELAASGTAGTPPPCGALLRSCGLSETILAAAVTGTATAGTLNTITLAAGSSAVDNAYDNMTLNLTGGTGSGQSAVIQSYVGATKVATFTAPLVTAPDATTVYAIPKQVVYAPITTNFESSVNYFYFRDLLHKLTGSRGTFTLAMASMTIPLFKFSLQGLFNPVVDGSHPQPVLTNWKIPLTVNNANTVNPVVMGYGGSVISDFNFDLGNVVKYENWVGEEQVRITDRDAKGTLVQELTTVAAMDWFGSIAANALGAFSLTHGTVPGSIVKIDAPQMQMLKPSYTDKNGIRMLQSNLEYKPLSGNDEITFCFM